MNICGCLIHVIPETSETAQAAIARVNGAEVHAAAEDGRLVVVVEDTPEKLASETIMDLHQIPGVISLSLTYHHFENPAEQTPRPDASSQTNSRRHMP
ncbi:nitrate reductase [Ruegeria sp. ANG-R]|uniref:chaperone NapD n=1 Tax=Ruegeria sp. ANG-R TaxID=1577903 RepID=UPI00057F0088|nr:chaperone NapD [Ruegeria sp. ANG-R]KIC38543.1 nitrate reductase [Ruegeria sp. ANG-R]